MAEADLGVRVFLIDNLSSPMGLVTGSIAMLGSALAEEMARVESAGNGLDALSAKMVEQQAAVDEATATWVAAQDALAANTLGVDDLSIALQDVQMEMQRVAAEPLDTFVNDAALQKAEEDLSLYEQRLQIAKDKQDLLLANPKNTAGYDIALQQAAVNVETYENKVQSAQAAIQAVSVEAAATQKAELASLKESYDVLITEQDALVVKAGEAGAALDAESAQLAEVQTEADEAEVKFAGLNATLLTLAATLGAGIDFFAFAEGIKQADQAAADLTTTMNSVSIAGNLTDGQLGQMQNYLMGVANTSIYTADQVGQGFALLEEKGYSATQVEAGLGKQAISLSMAIGDQSSGTTGSVNALATAMEVMRAKSSDAGKYADLLTFAFYHGIPSVDGLRSALEQVGGRAQMLGIPFDQLIAALSQLGRAGMTGQQAGASLNYMLQALYAPVQKTTHELEYLGLIVLRGNVLPAVDQLIAKGNALGGNMPTFDGTVSGLEAVYDAAKKVNAVPLNSTFYQWAIDNHLINDSFYDSNGKAKDLISTLHILYETLKDKTPEEQAAAFQQLFNVRSSQGVNQLMDNLGKLDATYAQLTNSQDALGLSTEDASKRLDSQSAQAQALKTTFTDFLAQVGQPIQNFMKNLFAGLNQVVGAFTTGDPQVHIFMTNFLLLGAALSGVALVVGLVILALTVMGGLLASIIVVVALTAAGIAVLAAGIALAVMQIQAHWSTLGPIIMPVVQNIQSGFQHIIDWAGKARDAIAQVNAPKTSPNATAPQDKPIVVRPPITKDLPDTMDRTHGSVLRVTAAVAPMTDSFDRATAVTNHAVNQQQNMNDTFDRAHGIIQSTSVAANPMVSIFGKVGDILGWVGKNFGQMLAPALKMMGPSLADLGKSFGQLMVAIGPLLPPLLKLVGVIIIGNLVVLISLLSGFIRGLAMFIAGIAQALSGLIQMFTGLIQFFHGLWDIITGIFTLNGDKIKHGFGLLVTGVQNIANGFGKFLEGLFAAVFGAIGGFVTGFVQTIIGFFKHLFDVLVGHSIIPDMVMSIINWFKKLPGELLGVIGGLASDLLNAGQNMMNMLLNGIKNGLGNLLGFVRNNVIGGIKNLLGFASPTKEGPGSDADRWMPNLMHMLTIGIQGGIPSLHNAASQAAGALQSGFYSPGMSRTSSSYAQANASINGGNTTVPINIDGQAVTTVVLNRLTGQVQMSGSGRLLR